MKKPGPLPDDETSRAIEKLAGLVRLQERASAENRPAMFHACQLLIGLEIGSLKTLAKPGSALPRQAPPGADAADAEGA